MPHQCLKCGKVFEEGSAQLLKGCPDCQGNRFFYTKKPLDEQERSSISDEMSKDITTQIMDLMGDEHKEVIDKSGKWTAVKPKEIRKILKEQQKSKDEPDESEESDTPKILDDDYRKAVIKKLTADQEASDAPETIDVLKPGKYKIDIKALLEEEPIIIQKDGSYTIHLPSIFKMIDKEK